MKLPWLEHSSWPTAREPDEKVVNPSPDRQLQDHLTDEVFVALERHDGARAKEAIVALINNIRAEESNATATG